jgi:hypothetical protein
MLEFRQNIPYQEISYSGGHQRVLDGNMGDILDSIDQKFCSAIDGITSFEMASRVGMCWSNLLFKCQALNNRCNFFWVSSGIDNKIDAFFISV